MASDDSGEKGFDGWDASEIAPELAPAPAPPEASVETPTEKDLKAWMLEALDKLVRARASLFHARGKLFPPRLHSGPPPPDLEGAWVHLQEADAELASLLPGAEPMRRKL